jgi:hypothetical protein
MTWPFDLDRARKYVGTLEAIAWESTECSTLPSLVEGVSSVVYTPSPTNQPTRVTPAKLRGWYRGGCGHDDPRVSPDQVEPSLRLSAHPG